MFLLLSVTSCSILVLLLLTSFPFLEWWIRSGTRLCWKWSPIWIFIAGIRGWTIVTIVEAFSYNCIYFTDTAKVGNILKTSKLIYYLLMVYIIFINNFRGLAFRGLFWIGVVKAFLLISIISGLYYRKSLLVRRQSHDGWISYRGIITKETSNSWLYRKFHKNEKRERSGLYSTTK